MTNATLSRPKLAEMPNFIVLACAVSPKNETHSVMVLNDESQHLMEAFSCCDIQESIQIQTALEKRHGDINYIVISPQIMLNMFSALALSEDGQIFHDDVFSSKYFEPIAFEQMNLRTVQENPVLRLILERDKLRELMEVNHTLTLCALSSLISLKEQLTGNSEFETACKHISQVAKNNEIHWGVTPIDGGHHDSTMPDTDL